VIYLVGGAPRTGKTILGPRLSAQLKLGWISTDLLVGVLRVSNAEGVKVEWDAAPEAIAANAEWFFPYLERFVRGVSCLADDYVIEGVDFLPAQVAQLSDRFQIRAVFLGGSRMTLESFDRFPGRSRGYGSLPLEMRQEIVRDVPRWSEFIRQECERLGYPYGDTGGGFLRRLHEAEAVLTGP